MQPRRLPKGVDAGQAAALLDSFHSWRDKAIAGLMLLSGLRSAVVLTLKVTDVDIPVAGSSSPARATMNAGFPSMPRSPGSFRHTCSSSGPTPAWTAR
jgi:hypothetical protein